MPYFALASSKRISYTIFLNWMSSLLKIVIPHSQSSRPQPPVVNSKEEFIEAVKQSGLVGLGGAGFPAHIKLNPKDKIEYLCINAAECEPYITADVREIMENHENVLYGISQVMKYVGIDKALIGIEDNKPEAS